MLTWLRSSTWWIPLLFAVLTGSVGLYSYRGIEQSTHAQLERELQTILDADVEALMLWVEVQKSAARAEAWRAALAGALRVRREFTQ